ncbi:UNVERIFIED_CONTAM: hypothetical protein NY603_33510, partial [Bacteroidetes bacterium 56_B9]
ASQGSHRKEPFQLIRISHEEAEAAYYGQASESGALCGIQRHIIRHLFAYDIRSSIPSFFATPGDQAVPLLRSASRAADPSL